MNKLKRIISAVFAALILSAHFGVFAGIENGQAVIRPRMDLCLTYDHQILDGAPAARFLQTIKHYLENPVWLLI